MKNDDFADGIYEILKAVDYVSGGGYDFSCGIDYKNDVFQTWNFWQHAECSCPREKWEWQVDSELQELMASKYADIPEGSSDWWRYYNMEFGNVTQGTIPAHESDCLLEDVGFKHFESGLEVSWYKRVGRDTKSNIPLPSLSWYQIVVECLESLKRDWTGQ